MGALALLVFGVAVFSAPAALAAEPPLATTAEASDVASEGATMNGRVDPNGAAVSVCRFEYGTTTAYGAVAPCDPASLGTGDFSVAVSARAEALEPGTTYHYRLVASGAAGATQGADRTFSTTGSPSCPNAAIRLEQGIEAIQLPDCMALEKVSPSKFNQIANTPMISADGERVSFWSLAPLANTSGNLLPFGGDVYVAEREAGGWSTMPTSPPYPITWPGSGNGGRAARSFTPDLSRWVVLGATEEASQYWRGIGRFFRGGLGGSFEQISPLLTPLGDGHTKTNVVFGELQGASANLERLFVAGGEASVTYISGDPVPSGPGSGKNTYVAQVGVDGQPAVKLAGRDEVGLDAGKVWGGSCGTRIGGPGGFVGEALSGWRDQGAVSLDGTRAFLSVRADQPEAGPCSEANKLRILERTEASGGGVADLTELVENECSRVAPACKTEAEANGNDFFQGASVDGTKVYFTTNRQLADSDLDGSMAECSKTVGVPGCDLYLYDLTEPDGERLTQVSAGEGVVGKHVVGEEANVFKGTVAISGDGSRVYFAAAGVLTDVANPTGKTADEYPAGDPKLYVWSAATGTIQFIGALAPGDSNLFGDLGTFYNPAYPVPATGQNIGGEEVGGDGHILLFQTSSSLVADDVDGVRRDAYRYDSSVDPPTLECVSCRPGGPDGEPFETSSMIAAKGNAAGTSFAEEGRWVSEDGQSVLIRTAESLVPRDLDGVVSDYLWRDGLLTLLPGTGGLTALVFSGHPVLSRDGSQVAFVAKPPLLPSDSDTAEDVYLARIGGGFPNPPRPPIDCALSESCQGSPAAGPSAPNIATPAFNGRGNVKSETQSRRCGKGKRRIIRKGKVRCVKKRTAKSRSTAKRANYNRGGRK